MQIKSGVGLVGALLAGMMLPGCMECPCWGGRKSVATPAISMPPRAPANPGPASPADPLAGKAAQPVTSPPEPTPAPINAAQPPAAPTTPAVPPAKPPSPTTLAWPPPPVGPAAPAIEPPPPPVATQSKYETRYPEVPTMPRPGQGTDD
jgi:hypothetical protein